MSQTQPTGEGTYIWKGYKNLDKIVKVMYNRKYRKRNYDDQS